MNKSIANSSDNWIDLAWSCLIMTAVLLAVFPVFAYFGFSRSGQWGVTAAGVAGGVCWLSGLTPLLLIGMFRGPQAALNAALIGILFRMGLPLCVAVAFAQQGGELAQAGILGMILGYYLVTLVVDTLLSIRLVSSANEPLSKAS